MKTFTSFWVWVLSGITVFGSIPVYEQILHPADLPSWAWPYGEEFWRSSGRISAGPNVQEAVERVSLAWHKQSDGKAIVSQPAFHAGLVGGGFVFRAGLSNAPEATLRTRGLRTDQQPLTEPARSSWYVLGNVAQARLEKTGAVLEHLEARPQELEWVWLFKERPQDHSLTVEVEIEGLSYAGQTDGGHHFADHSGQPRLRFGNVEAVDRAGHRWPIETTYRDSTLCITVPSAVLEEAAYPLSLDPAISAEIALDQTIVLATAQGDQQTPSVAWGATNYLVVWSDTRAGTWSDDESDIYGTRLSPSGQVLDPCGLTISSAPMPQRNPVACRLSNNFLVVWQDARNETNYVIYGARVSDGGRVLDPDGLQIGHAVSNRSQTIPWIAAGSNGALVVWSDARTSQTEIYGQLLDAAGLPLGASDFVIGAASNQQVHPTSAWGSTNYLVAWEDYRDQQGLFGYTKIFGARVSGSGVLMDTSSLPICVRDANYVRDPSVAWGSSNFLVVWSDARNASTSNQYDLYGARVTSSGHVLDPDSLQIGNIASNQSQVALVWGATNYWLIWTDYRYLTADIFGARVNDQGVALDPTGFPICITSDMKGQPALTWNGSQLVAGWYAYDDDDDYSHVWAARIASNGQVLDAGGVLLARSANEQHVPDVAWGVSNYLVVWRDYQDGTNSDIRGLRLDSAGTVLDPNGITICGVTNKQRDPAVAWGSNAFFVIWSDDRNLSLNPMQESDIYGARVSGGGAVLDPIGILISTNLGPQTLPDLAYNSSGIFLAVWQDYLTPVALPPYYSDIGGARITDAGVVLDQGYNLIVICTNANNQLDPAVAAGATNFLVVWLDRRSNSLYQAYGARVDANRRVLDGQGFPLGAWPTNQYAPAVSWGGTNYLAVWEDLRFTTNNKPDIYGSLIDQAGRVLTPTGLPLCVHTNQQEHPAVGWSGTNYLVVWTSDQNQRQNIFGARMGAAGQLLDGPSGVELPASGIRRIEPALAARSNGLFLLAYSGFQAEGFNAMRAAASFVDISPPALRVNSQGANCEPPLGTNFCVRGLPVTAQITQPLSTQDRTQFVYRAWTGTGSVPASGAATNTGAFVLNQDSVLTWHWNTNYLLTVQVQGRGAANWTNGWIPFASNIVVQGYPGAHFYFAGWQGEVPAGNTNLNPLTLTMSQPRLALINFHPYLTTNQVPHWWLAEHGLATNAATTLLDQDGDSLSTLDEYIAFTDPTNRNSCFAQVESAATEALRSFTLANTLTDRVYDVLVKTGTVNGASAWQAQGFNLAGTGSNLVFLLTNQAPLLSVRFRVVKP